MLRRPIRRAALVLAATLVLALPACGDDSGGASAASSGDDGGTTAADEGGAFPVTVEHKFGATEVPAPPERIVALGYTELDYVLALGHQPVAARYPQFGDESTAVRPWAEDEAQAVGGEAPTVLDMTFGELNFEAIAAQEPDLILAVTAGITREEYDTLSRIAPTVAQTDDYVDFGLPWQDVTTLIGAALGEDELAADLVTELEARFAAAREAHPAFEDRTLASAYYGADGVLFFAAEDLRARFFTDLGFVVPEELDALAGDSFYGELSSERLDLIDTDVLVWSQLQFTDGGRAAIEADPLVQALAATQDGRALYIGGEVDDALQVSTVLSLPTALEGIVPMLERATDDDPSTVPTPAT